MVAHQSVARFDGIGGISASSRHAAAIVFTIAAGM